MWSKSVGLIEEDVHPMTAAGKPVAAKTLVKELRKARHDWATTTLGRPVPTWSNMREEDVDRLWWGAHGWEAARAIIDAQGGDHQPDWTVVSEWEHYLWLAGISQLGADEWRLWMSEARSPCGEGREFLTVGARGAHSGLQFRTETVIPLIHP